MIKVRIRLPSFVLVAAIAALLMHRRAQAELQQNARLLRQNDNQLEALAMENQRLSNLVLDIAVSFAHRNV